jgi:CRP-like cAMP-binding protein
MPHYSPTHDLQTGLELRCERVRKPRHTVLFKRGQASFGMFLILSGMVALDFGVDGSSSLNNAYEPGALVGLPATLTGRTYSMTATVTDDAELGFISSEELRMLLREYPQLCRQLLDILSAKLSHTYLSAKLSHTYQTRKGHPKPDVVGLA